MEGKPKVRSLKSREKVGLQPLIEQLIPDEADVKRLLKGDVKLLEYGGVGVYFIGDYILARVGEKVFPALFPANERLLNSLPAVVVDMGAVGPVASGADVMRPGIKVFMGDFRPGDLIVVRDERHGKAIAIGIAFLSSDEAIQSKSGKVVKNLHHVDDKIWKILSSEISKTR